MTTVKIKNIEIKTGKKTINLSLKQAKKLKAVLDALFQPYQYTEWTYTAGDLKSNGTIHLTIQGT